MSMTSKRSTWRVDIKRTNTSRDLSAGVALVVCNSERILLEFQCDAGTLPMTKPIFMVKDEDEQPKEQKSL
jgi:hypothetical protein